MNRNDQSAGATPVVEGATPSQSYPTGSVFAAYRLPFRGVGSRQAGVCFDGEPAGGATPPAGDPPKPPAGSPPVDPPPPPATGDGDLGDAGKRALEAERSERRKAEDRAKAAEKERDELKAATASDSEKAIAQARKEGADEVIGRVHASVRRSAVREALTAAGALASLVPDLARADEFSALKVNDDDEIDPDELAKAMKAHKARVPDAYKPAAVAGSVSGGTRSSGTEPAKDLTSALERHYAPQQG